MLPIRLYDTLSREIREIRSEPDRRFSLYVCGPTVYGPAHIGNFITFTRFDLLFRALLTAGERPIYVRNITDVDDKTIQKAEEVGMPLREFTESWALRFHEDCELLNLLPPEVEPRATDHIPEQISLIERLVERGHAYQANDGSVYFRVRSIEDYGKLSHFDLENLQSQGQTSGGTRNLSDEYEREAVADFALWKSRKPEDGPNAWASPWGEGRPGWHLECSAMSLRYLGAPIDLHGGGEDLCFPHHENEIAQSEAATGQPFVRHWMHSVHLLVDGRKMSKSLGNFYTVGDLIDRGYDPMAIRYTFLSGHYRQQFNFTLDSIDASASALNRLSKTIRMLLKASGETLETFVLLANQPIRDPGRLFRRVWDALREDLNTPAALGTMFSELKELAGRELRESEAWEAAKDLAGIYFLFGLVVPAMKEPVVKPDDTPAEVLSLAAERWEAKAERDYERADALRAELYEKGWMVKDEKDSYQLRPIT